MATEYANVMRDSTWTRRRWTRPASMRDHAFRPSDGGIGCSGTRTEARAPMATAKVAASRTAKPMDFS